MTRLPCTPGPPVRAACVIASLALGAALAALPVRAQTGSLLGFYESGGAGGFGTQARELARERSQRLTELARSAGLLTPLEGALDPDTYRVGPNDVFQITVGGMNGFQAPAAVTSDGYLVAPDGVRIAVAGQTLAEATTAVTGALQAANRNVSVEVALAQPRQFYVHVNGAVPEPGRYVALPVARVDDVLRQAFFSETFDSPVANPEHRPALRNVHIRHQDGTEQTVDLVRYYRTGDVLHNPYLRDGDAVRVPAYLPRRESVYLDGEVAFPGAYDFRTGDTLLDVLLIAGGPEEADRLREVRLTRRNADGSVTSTLYDVASLRAPGADPVLLQPLDHVHVPAPPTVMGSVDVDGYVRYPGTYPIVDGETTLRELVDAAGGVRDDALLHGAYLVRPAGQGPAVTDRALTEEELLQRRQVRPYLFLSDTSSALERLRLGSLDFQSRYDLVRSLQTDNRVGIDMAEALQPGAEPIRLLDGDRLVVPQDRRTVRVIGQVMRPGSLPYEPGMTVDDYVRRAGGRAPKSGRAYVVRAGTGQILYDWDEPPRSGDVVFVERKGGMPITPELEQLALQQSNDRRMNTQLIISIVSATLTAVINAITIRELIRRE